MLTLATSKGDINLPIRDYGTLSDMEIHIIHETCNFRGITDLERAVIVNKAKIMRAVNTPPDEAYSVKERAAKAGFDPGKLSSKHFDPYSRKEPPKKPNKALSVSDRLQQAYSNIIEDKSQSELNHFLESIEYPGSYPSVYSVQDIKYIDGNIEIIYRDSKPKDRGDKLYPSDEPGHGVQLTGHQEGNPLIDIPEELEQDLLDTGTTTVYFRTNSDPVVRFTWGSPGWDDPSRTGVNA